MSDNKGSKKSYAQVFFLIKINFKIFSTRTYAPFVIVPVDRSRFSSLWYVII